MVLDRVSAMNKSFKMQEKNVEGAIAHHRSMEKQELGDTSA